MLDSIKFLKEFEGIIGAIIGSISTLIVTHWLKNTGKLTLVINDVIKEYSRLSDSGNWVTIDTLTEDSYAKLKFSIEIYNYSENIKTLNNVRYELIDDSNKVIHEGKLFDSETGVFSAGAHRYDKFEFLNCNPKQLVKKKLRISFDPSDVLLLRITEKIIIRANVKNISIFTFWRKRIKKKIKI
ncbi:hypothetical protein ACQKP0_25495 [Heyndrickxia sp. NPDC080065]|uniref:hypothetical protein n=1 Tax=Heyndrickxia sp. NPDC080065 TaxID=3390568 RepID=UPI003CFDE000